MAIIKIRGRVDPLIIDDERACKIKQRKFGVDGSVPKAEPHELIDLGEWSGEYGRIVEIEFSSKSEKKDLNAEMREQLRKEREKWIAQSAKQKAQTLGWFKIIFASRSGNWHAQPTPDVLEQVVALQESWYEKHPYGLPMDIRPSEYGELLPSRESKTIAQSMSV